MRVLKQGIAKTRIGGRAGAFTKIPAVIRSGDAVVYFFPGGFANVVDEHTSRARLKTEGEWIAQAHGPNRSVRAGRGVEERIVAGNRTVRIDAQNFAEAIAECLRIGGVRVLADGDVELSVRTKMNRTTVVITGAAQVI